MATDAGSADSFDLQRFIDAQAGDYERACRELAAGRKRNHWIWYVFPQMKGLGTSPMAHRYAIASLDEAEAYLAHPVLGPRLAQVTGLVLAHAGRSTLHEVFGAPDDLKFRSCMTLFARAAEPDSVYRQALVVFCGGVEDERTLALLGA